MAHRQGIPFCIPPVYRRLPKLTHLIKISDESKATLDRVKIHSAFVARVRSYDDAIQWLISHLDEAGIKELKG